MPIWLSILISVCTLVLGWALRFLYDLKMQPIIERSHRKAKKEEVEREEKERAEKSELIRIRLEDRGALGEIKTFLDGLNSIQSFPDNYPPSACHRLLMLIGNKAERMKSVDNQALREKLLRFASKKDRIGSNIPFGELLNIVNGKYDGLQPQDLINEVMKAF